MNSLQKILAYKTWRQRIAIDDTGNFTMGYLNMPDEWEFNSLPVRLDGKSFLDVGANDGYFPFEAEKRGATLVAAVDIYHHGSNGNIGGWNVEGIELLKEHFQSDAEIISKSIYDLNSLPAKYDIVLCSNVISWLDNMNEAIARLCGVCNDTLYLKDGFLTRFDPEPVLQYEKGKGLVAFRANLSYIKEVLKMNGFNRIEVKAIHSFKYFDWQTATFPAVVTDHEVMIYSLPDQSTPEQPVNCKGAWVMANRNGFSFVRNIGWVKSDTVKIATRGAQSLPGKLIRGVLNDDLYTDYIRRKGEESYVKSYMVIASR